jgi:hypothetical protein
MDSARRPTSPYWTLGAVYGATAVAFGAFGAHGLKKRIADPARIANWGTAAQYQVGQCPWPPDLLKLRLFLPKASAQPPWPSPARASANKNSFRVTSHHLAPPLFPASMT